MSTVTNCCGIFVCDYHSNKGVRALLESLTVSVCVN